MIIPFASFENCPQLRKRISDKQTHEMMYHHFRHEFEGSSQRVYLHSTNCHWVIYNIGNTIGNKVITKSTIFVKNVYLTEQFALTLVKGILRALMRKKAMSTSPRMKLFKIMQFVSKTWSKSVMWTSKNSGCVPKTRVGETFGRQ